MYCAFKPIITYSDLLPPRCGQFFEDSCLYPYRIDYLKFFLILFLLVITAFILTFASLWFSKVLRSRSFKVRLLAFVAAVLHMLIVIIGVFLVGLITNPNLCSSSHVQIYMGTKISTIMIVVLAVGVIIVNLIRKFQFKLFRLAKNYIHYWSSTKSHWYFGVF